MKQYYFGIDVGGTKVAYGLFDDEKRLQMKEVKASNRNLSPEKFFSEMAETIRSMMIRYGLRKEEIGGTGIGMPSFIEFEKGYIIQTANLPRIKDFAARTYMEKKLGSPVFLDNDANTAALAEYRQGAGRGLKHMLYCAVSTGISSGIIIDGKLFRGSYGWAGETGHMLIPGEDTIESDCGCGNNGCFMSHISGSMIVKRVQKAIINGETSIIPELCGGTDRITTKIIADAARKGDTLGLRAVGHMAEYLAVWLFNLYQTFNINCFVLGGGLVKMGGLLFDQVFEQFRQYNRNQYPVQFKFAELQEDFGIIGAAELVIPERCE